MSSDLFDRSRLSVREDAILEAAIGGLTDVQIAQKLEISQSTVNSYWVRIRGKLGQLSRTELVALALKAKAQAQMDVARAELDLLRDEARAHAQISEDYARAEVLRAALDAMPEAILVCCDKGIIRYVNPRLEAMFGYGAGELVGCPVADLLPTSQRRAENDRILASMKDPRPLRIGFDGVVYGQRKSGGQFRIVLLLDGRPTSTGPIFTCVIRDFLTEVDTRRAYAASWS